MSSIIIPIMRKGINYQGYHIHSQKNVLHAKQYCYSYAPLQFLYNIPSGNDGDDDDAV